MGMQTSSSQPSLYAWIRKHGSLVLVELKRDRTPREVVAQALDYASWVEELDTEHVAAIYGRFRPNRSLATDFFEKFGQPLDEDTGGGLGLVASCDFAVACESAVLGTPEIRRGLFPLQIMAVLGRD